MDDFADFGEKIMKDFKPIVNEAIKESFHALLETFLTSRQFTEEETKVLMDFGVFSIDVLEQVDNE
jgi:hypothetical protein